jgi:hypothetical protein
LGMIFISIKMKVAMRTLELGLVDKFVEVAPEARPGHLRVCGRIKSPDGVPFNFGQSRVETTPLFYVTYCSIKYIWSVTENKT